MKNAATVPNKHLKMIALFLILICISFSSIAAYAVKLATVPTRWDHILQEDHDTKRTFEYNTNYTYQELRYVNGFRYTETIKDVTSIVDILGGIITRERHYRNYTVY